MITLFMPIFKTKILESEQSVLLRGFVAANALFVFSFVAYEKKTKKDG